MKPSNLIIKANLKIFFTSLFLFLFFTFSSTSATTSSNEKPADYVNLHDTYTRAPADVKITDVNGNWTGKYSEYYTFSQNVATTKGYISQFRAFIPPGTIAINLNIKDNSGIGDTEWTGSRFSVARHKFPPTASPTDTPTNNPTVGNFSTLTELMDHECWSLINQLDSLNIAEESFSAPHLPISKSGWLYTKVSDAYSTLYYNHFSVRIDIKTYNTWWDKYIKDEAGWKTHIESVETYINPSI